MIIFLKNMKSFEERMKIMKNSKIFQMQLLIQKIFFFSERIRSLKGSQNMTVKVLKLVILVQYSTENRWVLII
jgi:hypothetical protein